MNSLREAAQAALEWIEAQPEPRMIGATKAITALRTALSEPGPVGTQWPECPCECHRPYGARLARSLAVEGRK